MATKQQLELRRLSAIYRRLLRREKAIGKMLAGNISPVRAQPSARLHSQT
jgi:hypothetical protein